MIQRHVKIVFVHFSCFGAQRRYFLKTYPVIYYFLKKLVAFHKIHRHLKRWHLLVTNALSNLEAAYKLKIHFA